MDPTPAFHGGAYLRGEDGRWHYATSGALVPGASDLHLGDIVPYYIVGDAVHGQVWVSRPIALTTPQFKAVLDDMPGPPPSINLPEPLEELPNATAVIMVPGYVWAAHAGDVVGMSAPELHPAVLMTLEMVARAAGLSEASVTEYIRRGACPAPQVRLGRSPMWARPVVSLWLATRPSQQVTVSCVGCDKPTEVEGLMVQKQTGGVGLLPVCVACYDRLLWLLSERPLHAQLTAAGVENLLRTGSL